MSGMQVGMADVIDFGVLFAPGAAEPLPMAREMAGQSVRLLRFEGVGGWHQHETAEETVIVWSGVFDVEYRDRTLRLRAGQCTVIARGQEHRGVSQDGADVVLLRTLS